MIPRLHGGPSTLDGGPSTLDGAGWLAARAPANLISQVMDSPDAADRPETAVMGRDALKQRSQGRVLEAQHRARQHQPPVYMTPPPRHQPPPQQPQQWRITGDMMNQPWGALLLRLLVPRPTPAFHLSHLRRRQCIAYSASMTTTSSCCVSSCTAGTLPMRLFVQCVCSGTSVHGESGVC